MNLLIVDDQAVVVQGLLKGVDWKRYGIEYAYGALSVAGALDVFDSNTVDVLLCDIEMPIENGLSLVNWVHQKKLDTQCILLTAHAKFAYAQQSIKLHIFDYILQPASYEHIAGVVQRAVDNLRCTREQEYLTSCGETFSRRENEIISGALHNWLCGYGNTDEIQSYVKLEKLPSSRKDCTVVLLQILRWTQLCDWTPALLAFAFENIAQELFASCGYQVLVAPMEESVCALLAWPEEETATQPVLEQQMKFFWNACQKHLGSILALYWTDHVQTEDLPEKWQQLQQMRVDNVSRKSNVVLLGGKVLSLNPLESHTAEIQMWTKQLAGEIPNAVEQEAVSILDKMSQNDQINAYALRAFYQDFLSAFYNALGTNNKFWHDTLNSPENFAIYREASGNVEQMKKFVHLAVSYFDQQSDPPEQELMKKIDSYIETHMEMGISRQDLASQVFLNADYLNRLIRKITGSSLKEYVSQCKMKQAKILLRTTRLPVAIVASKVGYISAAHFSVAYKKQFGKTPMQTRSDETE
ncbi:MAG: response regulator [Ruthenibacterium sp.]